MILLPSNRSLSYGSSQWFLVYPLGQSKEGALSKLSIVILPLKSSLSRRKESLRLFEVGLHIVSLL